MGRRASRTDDGLPAGDPTRPVFAFERVGVEYGGTRVLDDIELDIPGSGITVVVGASGSGKSTLTRLCDRLLDPTSGIVRLWGTDLRALDVLALRRTVGMVFQRSTLVDGTIAQNLAITGVNAPERHRQVLDTVGLEPSFLDRTATTLSGGEAQRVCLARTLLMEPGVLVADEPTSALDDASTRLLESEARMMADRGVPVLWVTHDLAQADRIADHRVELERGRVIAVGAAR